jgi:hypothetical protein
MSVESPAYEVIRRDGQFELRRYAGYLRAVVRVAAPSYAQATNAGFNPLADYIFGNNHTSDRIAMTAPVSATRESGEKIAMTAPVTASKASGEKIAMTAPVTAARADDYYEVTFTMPSGYSMEDLPQPNNPAVMLESVGPHVVATVKYSGYMNDKHADKAQAQLEEWMQAQGLAAVGEPIAAQYDAPWKPGFARHNEIMIPVDGAAEELH